MRTLARALGAERVNKTARRLDDSPVWAGLALGGLIGFGLAWGALRLGPAAAVVLALGLGGRSRARMRISTSWPSKLPAVRWRRGGR